MDFSVRVQLIEEHRAADWVAFYRAMDAAGFRDVVELDQDGSCRLLNGEWQISGPANNEEVCALLRTVVPVSGVPFRAMVMQITYPVTHLNPDLVDQGPTALSQMFRRLGP